MSDIPDFAKGCVNLASARAGARAVRASDDSFAAKERMLNDAPPEFRDGVYDDFGKWMDGWESKRRRDGGHDWCVVRLGARGRVVGFDVDTSHFTGNYPPSAAIFASDAEAEPAPDGDWVEVAPRFDLGPSARHFISCAEAGPWRWVKLEIHPDGGVARFRVYGVVAPDWPGPDQEVELSALANGGRIVAYNNAHYGDVTAVLTPGRGRHMGDGWETRRRREPGFDWLMIALGAPGEIARVEVDTAHFKGNYPAQCSLHAGLARSEAGLIAPAMFWPELMGPRDLGPDAVHVFAAEDLNPLGPVSHVRLNIHPDGGISRFRVFGRRSP